MFLSEEKRRKKLVIFVMWEKDKMRSGMEDSCVVFL